jgi:hypothetical protein
MSDRAPRTKMTDAETEAFLKSYIAKRGWSEKAARDAIRHCAATRWAALARQTDKHAAPPAKKAKGKKVVAKKAT